MRRVIEPPSDPKWITKCEWHPEYDENDCYECAWRQDMYEENRMDDIRLEGR